MTDSELAAQIERFASNATTKEDRAVLREVCDIVDCVKSHERIARALAGKCGHLFPDKPILH